MLNASTVKIIANPGNSDIHHLFDNRWSRLSDSMLPHVGTSGGTPRPRNDSAASDRITPATLKDAMTVSGAMILGRIVNASGNMFLRGFKKLLRAKV